MSSKITVFKGSPTGTIVKNVVNRTPQTGAQVLVEIHHSGSCGTDLYYLKQDLVLGHEGAGVVTELGPGTRYLKMSVLRTEYPREFRMA
jgi:Zn-dependent alcohol dehydrogenase